MSDYRKNLVESIEHSLLPILDDETRDATIRKIICILNDYEVTKRCTDVALYDDGNARIIKRYCACLMVDGKSKKTIYAYQRMVTRLLETIGKPVKEIGVYDIRYFLALEQERGISNRTIETERSYFSAFFQWATAEEIIQKNPCAIIKPIKYIDKERMAFSAVELDALRGACRNLKERAIIEMLVSSGIRVSELESMNVSDIDFVSSRVYVRHGKGGKERTTYITDVAKIHLQKYLMHRSDHDTALFCNKNHIRLLAGGIRHILKGIGKRAGVDNVHPHRFRRTFATGLATRGMSIQEIQVLLGHSDINTTMQYVCVDKSKLVASYKQYIA